MVQGRLVCRDPSGSQKSASVARENAGCQQGYKDACEAHQGDHRCVCSERFLFRHSAHSADNPEATVVHPRKWRGPATDGRGQIDRVIAQYTQVRCQTADDGYRGEHRYC